MAKKTDKQNSMGIEQTLKRAEVFLGLNDSDLSKIAALPSCREASYQAEEVIFRAGDEAKNLCILKDGQVNLVMEVPQKPDKTASFVVIDRITTGDFFGWSALVGPHLYVMLAICRKPSHVVVISGAELISLFESNYHIGYRIFQDLSRIIGIRLRYMEQTLLEERRWPFLKNRKGH